MREAASAKHVTSTLQEKNDDLVPISSDSDMEIVGLTDTSNRSKARIKKKKRKKKDYDIITIDDLISPSSVDLPITEFGTLKTHYRELSPVRRSGRSRVISRSPIRRHRSPVKLRTPIRPSRSPLNRVRSPISGKSPRRLRSPKSRISPHRSSPVRTSRRPSRQTSSPSARSYVNRHGDVTKLLKKVKHLDSMGILMSESSVDRSKEHQPSLKEKLSNMFKKHSSGKDSAARFKKTIVEPDTVNDADDEEDLALLRQKALETKQKKSNRSSDHGSSDVKLEKKPAVKNDDQDEEALELRMIALRSAVMKKHQNRVRRGIRTNKKPSRSESPFSQSFLDDIPVPGELLKLVTPPCTPSCDSNRIEDMELDSDVEGEKEGELPYSPTDKITTHVPIDTSLLGLEPSDVSFINVNETNNKSPIFDKDKKVEDAPLLTTSIASCYENSYLTSHSYEPQYYAYSPSQQCTEIFFGSDLNDEPGELSDHLRDCQGDNVMCDLIDGICCQVNSSTNVSDAQPIPVLTSLLPTSSASPKTTQQQSKSTEQSTNDVEFANVESTFRDDKCTYAQKVFECPLTTSPLPTLGYAEPVSPNESMVTIDNLPETETDVLNSVVDDKNLTATNHISKEITPCQAIERETLKQEPLYMQGVPDITKDVNKIPTLINKTLVPAPILRSNKQLQQPLLITKKCETQVSEPSFKSAEMQPVIVAANAQSAKNNSNFKPIKLRVSRKSAPILTTSVAFDNSTNENSENDALEEQKDPSKDSCEVIKGSATADTVRTSTANNNVALRKKRKRVKKDRCKSLDNVIQLITEKRNNSDDSVSKDVNIMSIVEQQIAESAPSEINDDNKTQESLMENGESKLQNAVDSWESGSLDNITAENKNTEKNDLASTSSVSSERSQEKNIESYSLLTNSASNNLESDASNKAGDVDNRRQSVDEDENELRAILLASLKRTKLTDINDSSSTSSITNFTATDTQTLKEKILTDTATINATRATVNNKTSSSTKSSSSETEEKKKKIDRIPTSLLANSNRKRLNNMDTVKGPQKKVMRKSIIPASTKAVNNAKKYQNMIVQRRSNLRKLDNGATKSNENVWSNANPSKTSLHVSDTQRFVINLESDTDSESDDEKRRESVLVSTMEKPQAQDIGVDFEQSLHKFLRDVRKEQEQSAVKPGATRDGPLTTKDSSNMHTPLVRHFAFD